MAKAAPLPQPDELLQEVRTLGVLTQQAIYGAMTALEARNAPAARVVLERDSDVSTARDRIDRISIARLTTEQPDAAEAKQVVAATRVSADLFWMAGRATAIAGAAERISILAPVDMPPELTSMGGTVQTLVTEALGAFLALDRERARLALVNGARLSRLHEQVLLALQAVMAAENLAVPAAAQYLSVAETLQAIGDCACSLCTWLMQAITREAEKRA